MDDEPTKGLFPLPPPLHSRMAEAEALAIMVRRANPTSDAYALVSALRLAREYAGIDKADHEARVNAFLTVYRMEDER